MRVACLWLHSETDVSRIAENFLRFSPQITIRKNRAVFVEIGKCRNLFTEDSFRAKAQALLKRFDQSATIGIGNDIPQSLILAKWGKIPHSDLPLEALHDYADPFGCDPEAFRSVETMIEAFLALGLKTISDFRGVPTTEIPSRFGALGLYCHQRIEDGSQIAWPHWAPQETIEERKELSYDDFCEGVEAILSQSEALLDRVFSRLRGRGQRLTELLLELSLEKYSTVRKSKRTWDFGFMLPHGSTSAVLPILRERLHRDLARSPLESAVLSIRYEVLETTLGYLGQKNLFHSHDDQTERFHSAFEHLAEGLGKANVFQAVTTEDRLPEKSWKKRVASAEISSELQGKIPSRPTRVFAVPKKVEVTREKIFLKKREFRIKSWSRPERISVDWLDQLQARNYFLIELENGPAFWIFQDQDDSYYLHGYWE